MSEELNIEKLREEVNPVYSTAQSCMQQIAMLGDADSEELRKTLGFAEFLADSKERGVEVPPEILNALMRAIPVFMATVEARFFSCNNLIVSSKVKNVLDLPCGYTARGIKLAKSGINYIGTDLPAVIDAMRPAVSKVIGENENINYHGVDATNYSSIRKALENVSGELHITTEGLLMYLTQSELETVFGNIRKILLEFGGRWVTVDNDLDDTSAVAMSAVFADMPGGKGDELGRKIAGIVSKTTLANNIFCDKDKDKVKKFVSDMGFDLELVPMKDYMPEKLMSVAGLSDDLRQKVTDAFGSTTFWVMTAKPGTVEKFGCEEDNFKADVKLTDDTLNISLTGRLDTITAPGLLALFKDAQAKGRITSICVDMKELEYISSAGLRVLMIMNKNVEDDKNFSLINMNDTVKDILETTGFDNIFC